MTCPRATTLRSGRTTPSTKEDDLDPAYGAPPQPNRPHRPDRAGPGSLDRSHDAASSAIALPQLTPSPSARGQTETPLLTNGRFARRCAAASANNPTTAAAAAAAAAAGAIASRLTGLSLNAGMQGLTAEGTKVTNVYPTTTASGRRSMFARPRRPATATAIMQQLQTKGLHFLSRANRMRAKLLTINVASSIRPSRCRVL